MIALSLTFYRFTVSGVGQLMALVDADAPAEPTMTLLPHPSILIDSVFRAAGKLVSPVGAEGPIAAGETGLGLLCVGDFPTTAAMIAPTAVTIAASTAAFLSRGSMGHPLFCAA